LAIAAVAYFELRGDWVTPEWLTGRHANVAALAPKAALPPADELSQQVQPRPVVSVVVSPPPSATAATATATDTEVIAGPPATRPASSPQRAPQGPKYYVPPVKREPSQREPEPTPASPAPDTPETRYGL
jgi:hypothetical protein